MLTQKVIEDFERDLRSITGKPVKAHLFGSYARGDFNMHSDLDLLLLIDDQWSKEDEERLRLLAWEYTKKYGVPFSVKVFKKEEARKSPLARKVLEGRVMEGKYSEEERISFSKDFLKLAERFLEQSSKALAVEAYNLVVHGAYYAVFHASKAYLIMHGKDPQTHKGVRAMVHHMLTEELSRTFDLLMDLREEADYDTFKQPSKEEAQEALRLANLYVDKIKRLLEEP